MADQANLNQQQQQQQNVSGIGAAALHGAREGEKSLDPDDLGAKLAQPAPGLAGGTSAGETAGSVSSTNERSGLTGGITDDQEDDEQEWRRAGGADNDQASEPRER